VLLRVGAALWFFALLALIGGSLSFSRQQLLIGRRSKAPVTEPAAP
jgi:hypothetical protein